MHINWYEGITGYLPAGWDIIWSLSIEEVFYLSLPAICVFGRKHPITVVLALVALSCSLPWGRGMAASNAIWHEKAYLLGIAAIATGVLAAIWVSQSRRPAASTLKQIGYFEAGDVLVVFLFDTLIWSLFGNTTMLILTICVAMLLIAFHWGWAGGSIKYWGSWLTSCGQLSYEIYLSHMFVVFVFVYLCRAAGSDIRHGWIFYPPIIVSCWVLGKAIEHLISTPSEKWLRAYFNVRAGRPSHSNSKIEGLMTKSNSGIS